MRALSPPDTVGRVEVVLKVFRERTILRGGEKAVLTPAPGRG